jgi:DNA-binding CsgD family transcriptional regulator
MGVFGMRPLVMMFLYHPDLAPKVDNTILAAAFGLTPGESKTTNLLAEGFSQKEIAEKLGIKHDTVRKQLQSIYYKTSTNKQSELIKLMLNLPSNFIDNTDTNILSNTLEKLRVKVLC